MKLLEQAQERILEMNKAMSRIEEIEQKTAGISEGTEVVFYAEGAGTTRISDIITREQMERIIKIVHDEIDTAKMGYIENLMKLMGMQTGTEQEAVTVPVKANTKKIDFDYDTVKAMYEAGRTQKDIAEHYGCAISVVSRFMLMNDIKTRPRGYDKRKDKTIQPVEQNDYPDLTIEAVKKIYTDGTLSIADTAKHFGVSSTELHSFVEKNGLKKVSKKDRIFKDADRLKQPCTSPSAR